jgi:Tfp pilus assembly protein PilN
VSQVNLLPPEIRQRAQTRRVTLMVIGAGVVVLVLIIFFFVVQTARLSRVNEDVAAQERRNAGIRAEIAGLQEFAALQAEAQAKQALLSTAFANEVSFSGVLLDLSRVIPSDAYLTTFSAQVAPPAAATPEVAAVPTETPLIGTMTAAGEASGADSLASWITRLESVKGWVNPWITTYTESAPASDRFTFNSGTDLTSDVLTDRARDAGEVVAP